MGEVVQRRQWRVRSRSFQRRRSILFQVPAPVAIPLLSLVALLTAMADYLLIHQIWFGPLYLLVSAFAAWFVSSRFAIALGLICISFKLLTDNEHLYPYGPSGFTLNFSLRFICVLIIVLMLGHARKSLERERHLARTDSLTGTLNRQAFFEAIEADSDRERPAVLAFADVDGLKHLNDKMGHEVGDKSLQDFTARVRTVLCKNDLLARIGGDEFVIFMKVNNEAAGKAIANRLNNVLNLDAQVGEAILKCSLGVLFLPEGSKSIDAELKLADQLMYVAKNARAGFSMASAIDSEGQRHLSFPSGAIPHSDQRVAMRSRDRKSDCVN